MSNDLISVIMSVYNDELNVSKAIDSILNQSYENIELLIIDDSSTDNSYSICEGYEKKYSDIIRLYKNKQNIGLTKSLNKLLLETNGKFIARQDSDDFSEGQRLEKQVDYMKKNKLDICYTRAYRKGKRNKIPGLSYYLPIKLIIRLKNPFVHGTLLCKQEAIKKVNGYDEKFIFAQDYKLVLDFINAKFKVSILKTPLYHLNMENNISTKYRKEQKYFADCAKKNIIPVT